MWEVKCDDGVFYYIENDSKPITQRKFSSENRYNKEYFVKWAKQLNEEA